MPPETETERLAGDGRDLVGRNADLVTARIDDLREDRSEGPHIETWVEDAWDYDGLAAEADRGYTGGGYCWVVREPDQDPDLTHSMPDFAATDDPAVLMILGRGAERWGLPGGGREGEEGFAEAARREVREETGVDCEPTDPFLLRRRVVRDPDDDRDPIHYLQAFFDAIYAGGNIRVQAGELAGAAWFERPPASVGVMPANERRGDAFFEG